MAEAAEMREYVVYWACTGFSGRRRVRATDADTARRDLETNPSTYGLPHERITVLRVLRCVTIEPRPADARAD